MTLSPSTPTTETPTIESLSAFFCVLLVFRVSVGVAVRVEVRVRVWIRVKVEVGVRD